MKSEIFSYEVTRQFNKLVGYYHKNVFLIFMVFFINYLIIIYFLVIYF